MLSGMSSIRSVRKTTLKILSGKDPSTMSRSARRTYHTLKKGEGKMSRKSQIAGIFRGFRG